MFQRFKEASSLVGNFVDQLADEQNRLRTQQAQPASTSGRRPTPRARPSGSPGPRNQRTRLNDAEKGVSLSGADPDPSTFDDPTATADAKEIPGQDESSNPADTPLESESQMEKPEGSVSIAPEDGSLQNPLEDASPVPPQELPSDVEAKLRKLSKLEGKYQELLKAYRRAHARNSVIEPFEACLRENTPLTSISDPTALVEYLNQLNTKGDMVMTELKSVSAEKNDLKRRLEEAEEKTKAAYDEMTQLRQPKEQPEVSDDTVNDNPEPPSRDESAEEVFSFDQEVPRLQEELQQRGDQIVSLEQENGDLKRQLGVAKESAEQIMQDMESARKELEAMHVSHEQARKDRHLRCEELESTVEELEKKLKTSALELESMRTSQDSTVSNLKSQLDSSETALESVRTSQETIVTDLESRLSSSQAELGALRSSHTRSEDEHNKKCVTLEEVVVELRSQLGTAEVAVAAYKAEIREYEKTMAEGPSIGHDEDQVADVQQEHEETGSKKKKNKKKKKKGAIATPAGSEPVGPSDALLVNGNSKFKPSANIIDAANESQNNVESDMRDYASQLNDKDATIDKLQQRLREQDDLLEEIESLKDELISVGQEHVEAKDQLVQLRSVKEELEKRVAHLETEIDELRVNNNSSSEDNEQALASLQEQLAGTKARTEALETERAQLEDKVKTLEVDLEDRQKTQANSLMMSEEAQKKLEADFDDLKIQSRSLQTDLSAAELLATTRYKEMTNLRDMLQKAQPELQSLRTEVVGLRTSKDELTVKAKELRRLELREESLEADAAALRVDLSTKEADIKVLNQRFSQESSQRLALEESHRRSQRDLQRVTNERVEAVAAKDSLKKDHEEFKNQADNSRAKLQQLEHHVEQLNQHTVSLRDEISLKTAQHASAEMLMGSVRDQAAEMATQMKEAKERCDSLEEELTDAHRLMSERGRESETMRRMLAEVEGRAEVRVKEMRERMELAIQERDRAEDDASSIGRRRARELEDMKSKLREVERDLKYAVDDKGEAQKTEMDLRRQKTESDHRIEQSAQEVADVRKAMSELRDALDEGEKQARGFEMERNEVKRSLEEIQQRVEKLQKSNKTLSDELRSARVTRIRPTDSPAQSARSSIDSPRPSKLMSPGSPRSMSGFSAGTTPSIDYVYLKNVLLQFLEQKDKNHQMQLIPVLSMLLHFDRKDEQKWVSAISAK